MSISEKKINQDSAKCSKDQEAMGKESEKLEGIVISLNHTGSHKIDNNIPLLRVF